MDAAKAILGTLLLLTAFAAAAWSGPGHHIVGAVADDVLEKHPNTKKQVAALLGGKSLAEVAVWADCAKGFTYCQRHPTAEEATYAHNNPRHHNFHYTDLPLADKQYVAGTAGTEPEDVVQVMRYAIAVLQGKNITNPPAKLSKREALWLLAHLVGDIHQPLHVGAIYFDAHCAKPVDPNVVGKGQPNFGIGHTVAETQGGNFLMRGSEALHHYWDANAVTGAMKLANVQDGSIAAFAKILAGKVPVGTAMQGDPLNWPQHWATEVMPLAQRAIGSVQIGKGYPVHDGKSVHCQWPVALPDKYEDWASQQALSQLAKAGHRLAGLLVVIFEGH